MALLTGLSAAEAFLAHGTLSAAFGIDNLNNYRYWNFQPYPQRSYTAELKFVL